MSKKTVMVLMGGPDAERHISIQSGAAVAEALRDSGNYIVEERIIHKPTLEEIINLEADVFFPVLHGPYGEGGPLQKLLEDAEKSFVGSSSNVAKTAMDKAATKQIALDLKIQTPTWCVLSQKTVCSIPHPLVLKPIDDGSSFDISICTSNEEVEEQRCLLHKKRTNILAEQLIVGREVTVGIINGSPLPLIEIIPPKDLQSYNYEAKYERNDTQFIVEPKIPSNTCIDDSLLLYKTMGIRDIARVDFILNESGAWLLELNTMPGFTDHSLVPMAAEHAEIPMPELCSLLVNNAARSSIKL